VQLLVSSVPLRKYSGLPLQILCTICGGGMGLISELCARRFSIILCQIGAAPVIPEASVGLILALLVTGDGTNNLAEREFRQLVISRYISFGSASFEGMEITAILSNVLQTIHRDKEKQFLPTLKDYLVTGIQEKYPQYKHFPSFAP
jgi:hypothetical protein